MTERSAEGVSLVDATSMSEVGEGRYEIALSPAWGVGTRAHGGYLLAALARAGLEKSPHPHPIALSAHFSASPDFGLALVTVEEVKVGRTTAVYRASLGQGGRRCVEAIVTTGRLSETPALQWADVRRAAIAPLVDCEPNVLPREAPASLLSSLDVRLDPSTLGGLRNERSGELETRAWIRLRDGSRLDPLALLVIADGAPPPVFNVGRFNWAPTVQMTPLLRAMPSGDWLQVLCRGRLLADGWFDSDAQLWDESGTLVMQARQLGLALSSPA